MTWKNYGDVNPIEHGGIFIKEDELFERCYDVVAIYQSPDDVWILSDMSVDLDDDWINWDRISSYADMDEGSDDVDKVIELVSYYSHHEFGVVYEIADYDEVIKALKEFGISVN